MAVGERALSRPPWGVHEREGKEEMIDVGKEVASGLDPQDLRQIAVTVTFVAFS